MENTLEYFIGAVIGILIGAFIGVNMGEDHINEQVVKQCSTKGLYIIDGVAIQCPVVVKTKE